MEKLQSYTDTTLAIEQENLRELINMFENKGNIAMKTFSTPENMANVRNIFYVYERATNEFRKAYTRSILQDEKGNSTKLGKFLYAFDL